MIPIRSTALNVTEKTEKRVIGINVNMGGKSIDVKNVGACPSVAMGGESIVVKNAEARPFASTRG